MSESLSTERTRNYLRQIKGSVLFRGLAVVLSFITLPMMIGYLGQEQFGVWSTLLSIMSWVVFFDLGIGNGLRNKVAESLAKGNPEAAVKYVSSAYVFIGAISFMLWLSVTVISFYMPWQAIFNTTHLSNESLRETVQITLTFICINFWIGLITPLLGSVQKSAYVTTGQFATNLCALIFVYALNTLTDSDIRLLAAAYGVSLLAGNLLLSGWFYSRYKNIRPRIVMSRFIHAKPLIAVGLQFFALQFAVLVIFTADKMLIAQLFGPSHIAKYEVVFKYFSVVTLLHSIITAPLWSAYTDAYHRNDMPWIKATLINQIKIYSALVLAVFVLCVAANPIISIWVGSGFDVPMMLIISFGAFVLVTTWVNIFAIFLNGVQKIYASVVISLCAMVINIPVSILLAKYTSLGISSVLVGTICALMPGVIFGPYQSKLIVNHREHGIWAR